MYAPFMHTHFHGLLHSKMRAVYFTIYIFFLCGSLFLRLFFAPAKANLHVVMVNCDGDRNGWWPGKIGMQFFNTRT